MIQNHSARGQDGVSLLELIVAFAVLLLVTVPISYVLTTSVTDASAARFKTTALSVAEQWIETLNNEGPPNNSAGLPEVGTRITEGLETESGVTYRVSAEFDWASENGIVDLCAAATVPQILNLVVSVGWVPNQRVTDVTIIDYPPASLPTNGFIGVQINGDPSGSTDPEPSDDVQRTWGGPAGRVTTIPITATSISDPSLAPMVFYPNANGCAFAEVLPGSYRMTIGSDALSTSFVGIATGSTVLTTAVTVSTNQVSEPGPFLYDEGAFIDLQFPNTTVIDGSVACPNAAVVQCLVTGQSPVGSAPDGSTGITPAVSAWSGGKWSSTALPTTLGITTILSSACATLCMIVGTGPTGAGAAVYDSTAHPNTWSASSLPAGTRAVQQVVCPTSTSCLAVASTSSGTALLGAVISGQKVTWSIDGLPLLVTGVRQISCAGSKACVVLGTSLLGNVILNGAASGAKQTFSEDSLPLGTTTVTEITCPVATACLAIGTALLGTTLFNLDLLGPVLMASLPTSGAGSWIYDGLPSGVTSLQSLTCFGSGGCFALGSSRGKAVLVAGSSASAKQTWSLDTLPNGVTTLTGLTCTGGAGAGGSTTGACFAISQTTSGTTVIAGGFSSKSETWVTDTLPTGVTSISGITCTYGASTCLAIADNGTLQHAVLLSAAATATTQTLVTTSLPSGSPLFFTGIACYVATSLSCAVAGANTAGAMVETDSAVGVAGSPWKSTTLSTVPGLIAAHLPITVSNSEPPGTSLVACVSGACGSSIGPLFPYASGYSIGAGNCLGELGNASVHAVSVPGTTIADAPVADIPLGFLAVKVLNSAGHLVQGAVVTVTVADPNVPVDASCNGFTTSMGTTGSSGIVNLDVMYETYEISVGGVSEAQVTVTPSATLVIGTTGTVTAHPLPQPVVVP